MHASAQVKETALGVESVMQFRACGDRLEKSCADCIFNAKRLWTNKNAARLLLHLQREKRTAQLPSV